MIDNIEKLLKFLEFSDENDFYLLQLIKRRKDCEDIKNNSRVIKEYYIHSQEYLLSRYEEIKDSCEFYKCRASLRLNKRNSKDISFHLLNDISVKMLNKNFNSLKTVYSSVCGRNHSDKNKKWIVDIDRVDVVSVEDISNFLFTLRPLGSKVLEEIDSLSGLHLITSPFDLKSFRDQLHNIDVHKDNPTNLYIPNSLTNLGETL